MKMSFSPPLCFLIMLLLLSLSLFGVSCRGQEQENASSGAPMERGEQEALYYAIQGFVGKWWNGSDLYPDPCGWTPIQVLHYSMTNMKEMMEIRDNVTSILVCIVSVS